jgi:hypothetical protein
VLVLLGDKINDQSRCDDSRHEYQERDQQTIYELVEVPVIPPAFWAPYEILNNQQANHQSESTGTLKVEQRASVFVLIYVMAFLK